MRDATLRQSTVQAVVAAVGVALVSCGSPVAVVTEPAPLVEAKPTPVEQSPAGEDPVSAEDLVGVRMEELEELQFAGGDIERVLPNSDLVLAGVDFRDAGFPFQ